MNARESKKRATQNVVLSKIIKQFLPPIAILALKKY